MDAWIKILERSDGQERVVISRRADGVYTYRHQLIDPERANDEDPWGRPGPECGLYDSSDTAETEAMQRVEWLKAGFH
jgi:hypothetical protein